MTYADQKLAEARKALILARDAEAQHVPAGVLSHALRMVDACIAKADRNWKQQKRSSNSESTAPDQ